MARIADPNLTSRRKREILQATIRCVISKGFHAASMKDICKEAAISAGGLYRYFGSKDEIILALVEEEQQENQETIALLDNSARFIPALEQVVRLAFQAYSDPDYGRLAIELMAEAGRNLAFLKIFQDNEKQLKQALVTALQKGQDRKEITRKFSPRVQAEFILSVFDGFSARILLDPECSPKTHIKTVMDNLKHWLTH